MTGSMDRAIGETNRRRAIQIAYNKEAQHHAADAFRNASRTSSGDIERTRKRAITELADARRQRLRRRYEEKSSKEKRRQMHEVRPTASTSKLRTLIGAMQRNSYGKLLREERGRQEIICRKYKENVPLAPLTTFQIGGDAKYLVDVRSDTEIKEAITMGEGKRIRFVVLAGGSNVLGA